MFLDSSGVAGRLCQIVAVIDGGDKKPTALDPVLTWAVTDEKTNQTAPDAPTVSALSSFSGIDVDSDGSLDTGLQFTVTAPASGPPPKLYDVQMYKADAQGSSGSMTGYTAAKKPPAFPTEDPATSADTLIQIETVTTKWFKLQVRCVGFNGKKGAWSTIQNLGFKPAGKTAGPADPSSLSITLFDLGFRIKWLKPSEDDYARTEIAVLPAAGTPTEDDIASTVIARPVSSSFKPYVYLYIPITNAPTYIYVRHVNTSNVPSNWSFAGGFTRAGISGGNIAVGSIDYDKWSATALNDANADLALGAVGTYAFLRNDTGSTIVGGSTAAGSGLAYSCTDLSGTTRPSGTWRALGRPANGQACLFLRVS